MAIRLCLYVDIKIPSKFVGGIDLLGTTGRSWKVFWIMLISTIELRALPVGYMKRYLFRNFVNISLLKFSVVSSCLVFYSFLSLDDSFAMFICFVITYIWWLRTCYWTVGLWSRLLYMNTASFVKILVYESTVKMVYKL